MLYCPAVHGVQVDEPGRARRSVVEPAAHNEHALTFDSKLYLPVMHIVQVDPPESIPVSVIDPGMQRTHCTVAAEEYIPAAQREHVVAPLLTTPVPAPISAIDPDEQVSHVSSPATLN
eukprot:COSAG01_NODE_41662_length_448_cov_4.000000_1_plen_117_part_01